MPRRFKGTMTLSEMGPTDQFSFSSDGEVYEFVDSNVVKGKTVYSYRPVSGGWASTTHNNLEVYPR